MAYEKKNFTDGIVLSAEHLNYMETGIEDAHNMIGTADISAIGDGTIKGAILALKALIESGGGSSGGGEPAEAFTVSVQDESYYGEAEYIDLGEGGPYAYKVSDTVPTMEQMQACNFEGYFGEATYDMTAPQVEDDWSYYRIKFTEFEGTAITSSTPQIIVPKSDFGHTMGVYVCFDGCEDAYNKATGGTSTMSSGTISFPEV